MKNFMSWIRRRSSRLMPVVLSVILLFSDGLEGRTISAVKIRYQSAKTVDESRLRDHMSVRPGQKYNPEILNKDAASLYESGLVDDVSFLGEAVGDEKIVLSVEVSRRGQVVEIEFSGNTVFSDRKLAGEVTVKAGIVSDTEILDARRKIEEQYKGYGYPDVLVSHRLEEAERRPRACVAGQ